MRKFADFMEDLRKIAGDSTTTDTHSSIVPGIRLGDRSPTFGGAFRIENAGQYGNPRGEGPDLPGVRFIPVNDDIVDQHLAAYGTGRTPQQMAMRARIESARAARMRYGVPQNLSDYFMNYDATKVKRYVTPDGRFVDMPEYRTPQPPPPDTYFARTPVFMVDTNRNRSYAAGSGFVVGAPLNKPGMLHKFTVSLLAHEGLMPFQGHFGTRSYGIPLGTYFPYVRHPGRWARYNPDTVGLPYYSMTPAALGGDPGNYGYQYSRHRQRLNGPSDWGKPFKVLTGSNTGSYYNSPSEFAANASIFKSLAASIGLTGLNTFDPDNPGAFLDAAQNARESLMRHGGEAAELVGAHHSKPDELFEIIQRYADLHNKRQTPGGLTEAEEEEYQHMRRAIPAIWDQASNRGVRRPGVHGNPTKVHG